MSNDKKQLLSEDMLSAAAGVLGSMLLDARCIGPVLALVTAEDFQLPEHRTIFAAIKGLFAQGKPVDPILVREVVGARYTDLLTQLMEITPTAANADAYAKALRKSARMWQLQELGTQLSTAESPEDARALIDKANLLMIDRAAITSADMADALHGFVRRQSSQNDRRYLPWCFSKLSGVLHVEGGDMVVIGGYPSAGKTAFALQLAFAMAKKGLRIGFYSYETDISRLMERIVSAQTDTSFAKMQSPGLDKDDMRQILDMRDYIMRPTLRLIEASGLSVSDIGAFATAHHHDVIFVDYLQKIPDKAAGRWSSDFERVSHVSNDLQQLARSTGKTVVALSQLSRAEKSKGGAERSPTMSSLRQSGQIEQDADVILLLYKEQQEYGCTRRVLDIAKNKNGQAGLGLILDFDGDKQTFRPSDASPAPRKSDAAESKAQQQSLFYPVPAYEPSPFDPKKE